MTVHDSPADVVDALADRLGSSQVFGLPVQQGGTTLVPVAKFRAGGGVGQLALAAVLVATAVATTSGRRGRG